MNPLISLLNDVIVILFTLAICTRIFSLRKKNLCYKTLMYGGCTAIFLVYALAAGFYGMASSVASVLCVGVPGLFLFLGVSKHRDSRFCVTFFFVHSLALIIGFTGRYIGTLTSDAGSVLSIAVTAGLYLMVIKLGNRHFERYHELLELVDVGWNGMAFSMGLIYFSLVFFAAYPKPMIERLEYGPAYLVYSGVILSCYNIFLKSIIKTRRITEQNRILEHEKEIYKIAYTDSLTGLGNRAAYVDLLNRYEREQREGRICCIMIDLNNLKTVNDSRGHHMGDIFLKMAADALRQAFTGRLVSIFRIGGDEFSILAEEISEKELKKCLGEAGRLLQKKEEETGLHFNFAAGWEFLDRNISCLTIEDAFMKADQMMYRRKRLQKEAGGMKGRKGFE